jgi:hypothetical protein
MKKLIKSIVGGAILLTSLSAKSYDVDTHFYGTYSMARFAGIRHEIALKLATGTQWMDESYISDPVSMIVLPDVGIKKRRLLHFPGSRIANKMTISQLPSMFDPSSGVKLRSFTETEADHEFATEMFTEGLMQGDLMKVATGLHTLEDSFAHAGTIAELGHAHFWHHPDRPYVDDQSVEKYFKMCRSVLKAMVAIRYLLPASGLDMDVKFGDQPNYKLNGDKLADIYTNLPMVRKAISRKILNEPSFVKFALDNIFKRAKGVAYIKSGYERYLDNFKPGQDTYQAAGSVAESLPPEMVNVSGILRDTGRSNLTPEYIISMGGLGSLLTKVLTDLMTGIVPRPMDAYHRFEKEEDGPIWIKEVDLRVLNMRSLINNLYGKNIYFVPNNTSGKNGYLKELANSPAANPRRVNAPVGVELVTYSLAEKRRFNDMVFKFMFPKLSTYMKGNGEHITSLLASTHAMMDKDKNYAQRLGAAMAALKGVFSFGNGTNLVSQIKIAREDISGSRIVPNQYNRYFTVPGLVRRQVARKVFKPLLTPQQVDALVRK